MKEFLEWLATSPLASAAKVALAAALGWLLANADSLELHPVLVVAIVAAVPVLINYLNPLDSRYGRHAK